MGLEAVAKPALSCCRGTVEPVPMPFIGNRAARMLREQRLEPLRVNDAPQGLKPLWLGAPIGTTKVVP
jgi:hypothetical protein